MKFVKASSESDDDRANFNTEINYNMYSEESYYYEFYTIKKYGLGYKGDSFHELSLQNQEQLKEEEEIFIKARALTHSLAYHYHREEYKWQTGDPIYIELKTILNEVNKYFSSDIKEAELRQILKNGGNIYSTDKYILLVNGPTEDDEVQNLETTEPTYPKSYRDVLMSKLNIEVEKPYKIMKI